MSYLTDNHKVLIGQGLAGFDYGRAHNRHADWHSSVSGLGDDALTISGLHDQAISRFAASGAQAGVVAVTPAGEFQVVPQSPAAVGGYYDAVVEQANQGAYVYVAMFDKTNANTADGLVDETFTGVGITSTIVNTVNELVYSPWVIVGVGAALVGVVLWADKKKRRGRARVQRRRR
jgi:hypothetical protein